MLRAVRCSTLIVTLAWSTSSLANTYYVATNGDDAKSCDAAKTESTPKQHIAAAIQCLTAGDTLLIRGGVYAEALNEYQVPLPSGTSWTQAVTIAGYPGEAATLQPDASATEVLRVMGPAGGTQYVIFDNLILDAVNVVDGNVVKLTYSGSDPANKAHHIRISNSEIMNAPGQGILGGQDSEFINLRVHDNGKTDFDHGIYIGGNNNLIEGCEFYRNAGWGIHKYPKGDNDVIRNNRVHDNARVGDRGTGIGVYGGTGNLVYNNLVWGNNGGIVVQYGESNARIYANTIYGNKSSGIYNGTDSTNASFKNNLVFANDSDIENLDPATTVSDNSCAAAGDGCTVVGDPGVVSTSDFHLTAGSPVIDKGVDLTSEGVTTDFDGLARPQGAGFDIGAFEYCASGCATGGAAGAGGASGGAAGATNGGTGGKPASGGGTAKGGSAAGGTSGSTGGKGGETSDDGSCGCRVPARSRKAGDAFAFVLLLGATCFARRRRRLA